MVQSVRHWSSTASRRYEAVRLAALMAVSDNYRTSGPLATKVRFGVFQVTLTGDIDLTSSRQLTLIAEDFLQSDQASAAVDLRGITSIDSAGLLLLARLHRTAVARGGRVMLVEPSGTCLRALEGVAFDEIFEIQASGVRVPALDR